MYKYCITTIAALLLGCLAAWSAGPPVVSVGDDVHWYALRFCNGKAVVSAQGEGRQVRTSGITGSADQMWKIEGSDAEGYTLTSRSGQQLYAEATSRDGQLKTSAAPASVHTRFVWSTTTNATYAGHFVLSPKENTSVFMNQWGGAGQDVPLALWNNRSDENQPFEFVSEEELLNTSQRLPLIPYPAEIVYGTGRVSVSGLSGIYCPEGPCQRYAGEFAEQLKLTSGIGLAVTVARTAPAGAALLMTVDGSLPHEAYTLKADADGGIAITAADSTGFFYALQTLRQLLPVAVYGTGRQEADWSVPCVEIKDRPQLGHRGFMMDVARHFFSKVEVKRVLDIMAAYKMNRLHLHLTDDQGWRVEIPEYPRLTEVGSIRKGSFTNAGGATKFFDDTEYGRGMWFSLDDLREIVAYAKSLNIEILPEIDLPGHMVAAVTAYPEFSCDPSRTYEVRLDGGISQDVLNVGKDEVVDFLKCVLGHVAEVFPYPYIHIGGDECPTGQWADNADCLRRVAEEGLTGVEQLQSWLVEELGVYLKEKYDKDIVVWDELLAHWSATNQVKPVIMAWNSIGKSSDAANKGFRSIVCPYQALYLDFMQVSEDKADINELYQGGWGPNWVNSVESVYNLNPVASLNGREDYCMGVQGNLWAETLCDSVQLEYQLLPRMLALSETGWLPAAKKDWMGFYRRLQTHDEILDLLDYTYARHYFEQPVCTGAETAVSEARSILGKARPGCVGHPAQSQADALETACRALEAGMDSPERLTELQNAIRSYKDAPITQPEEGKLYEIVSAATYYKAMYAGSTVYVGNGGVRFHYTPQTEPEELWTFRAKDAGYTLQNAMTGQQMVIPDAGSNVSTGSQGTTVRIDLATTPSGKYTFVPGAVTISSTAGYAAGNYKRLYADCTGYVKSDANGAICYPGTWFIREVTDFTAQLGGLVKKGELILLTAVPDKMGEPTQEALDFLSASVVAPASAAVKAGGVTREVYEQYVALYRQYLAMPRNSVADGLDRSMYYRIRNAYFTNYYATGNAAGNVVPATLSAGSDYQLWRVGKNADGSVTLTNKGTGKDAYPASVADAAVVKTGAAYNWTLEMITTDTGGSGIAITDAGNTFSWYTNPSSWQTVILKPKDWGASVWTFEKTSIATGITAVGQDTEDGNACYDLLGRRVEQPAKGIFITGNGRKMLK